MLQTFWLFLTYSYNFILVLFIATHLFVGAIISFLTGTYIGVYLTQNYEIPRINDPRLVWEKFLTFLERNRKNPEKLRVGNLLRPSTLQNFMVAEESQESAGIIANNNSNTGAGDIRATSFQTESETEVREAAYENDDINMITTENELVDTEDVSEKTDTATLEATSESHPIKENVTTLILTEPEDLVAENLKTFSSPQIVEASLTLDKDRAISRSWSKLSF